MDKDTDGSIDSDINDRTFPIQGWGPVPWAAAERAYDTYVRVFGRLQTLERLAKRGGFGAAEFACLYLDHNPCVAALDGRRHEPEACAIRAGVYLGLAEAREAYASTVRAHVAAAHERDRLWWSAWCMAWRMIGWAVVCDYPLRELVGVDISDTPVVFDLP